MHDAVEIAQVKAFIADKIDLLAENGWALFEGNCLAGDGIRWRVSIERYATDSGRRKCFANHEDVRGT